MSEKSPPLLKKFTPCERFVQNAQVREILACFYAKSIARLPSEMVACAINLYGCCKFKLPIDYSDAAARKNVRLSLKIGAFFDGFLNCW